MADRIEPGFRALYNLHLTDRARCEAALQAAAVPADTFTGVGAPASFRGPCHRLVHALARGYPSGVARRRAVCEALGYRWVGDLPADGRMGPAAVRRLQAWALLAGLPLAAALLSLGWWARRRRRRGSRRG